MPVAGDDVFVAPVITHVRLTTPQLSLTTAFGVVIDILQVPVVLFFTIAAGHVLN